MTGSSCSQLEDFVDGELGESDARAFEGHARSCPACRQAVREWRDLSGLLHHAYRSGSCELPRSLLARRRQELRLRRLAACLAAVAAGLLVWAAATFLWQPQRESPERRGSVAQSQQNRTGGGMDVSAAQTVEQEVQVLCDSQQMIVRRLPSRNENVTVVWMYPTIRSTN
jgi:anti-sigma factor RsiW